MIESIDQSLINEMQRWAEIYSQNQRVLKALRIYCKCMLTGRFKLAAKIENKYGKHFPGSNDRVIAFHLALLANKKIKHDTRKD